MAEQQRGSDRAVHLAVFDLGNLDYGMICAFIEGMGEEATVYSPGIRVSRLSGRNTSEPIPVTYKVEHHRGTISDASNKLRVVGNQIWTKDDEILVEGRLRSKNIEYRLGHVATTSEANTRSEPFDINDSWEVHYRGRKQ